MPPPSHTTREKACSLSNEDGELGDGFLAFPTFSFPFAKETPPQSWHGIIKNNKGEGLEGKGK